MTKFGKRAVVLLLAVLLVVSGSVYTTPADDGTPAAEAVATFAPGTTVEISTHPVCTVSPADQMWDARMSARDWITNDAASVQAHRTTNDRDMTVYVYHAEDTSRAFARPLRIVAHDAPSASDT